MRAMRPAGTPLHTVNGRGQDHLWVSLPAQTPFEDDGRSATWQRRKYRLSLATGVPERGSLTLASGHPGRRSWSAGGTRATNREGRYYKIGRVKQDDVYLQTANVVASEPIKESGGTRYVAPEGRVLVGRSHRGDETGTTRSYHAQVLDKWGQPLTVVHGTWSNSQKESSSSFEAPAN